MLRFEMNPSNFSRELISYKQKQIHNYERSKQCYNKFSYRRKIYFCKMITNRTIDSLSFFETTLQGW